MFIKKSIKLGKHARINVTKNGVSSVTFGNKNARVGVRKDGSTYASISKNGIYARQELTGKTKASTKKNHRSIVTIAFKLFGAFGKAINTGLNKINKNNKMVQNHSKEEINQFYKEHYTRHLKFIFTGIVLLFIGILIPPILLASMASLIIGIGCMTKNWKRINEEWKTRTNKNS